MIIYLILFVFVILYRGVDIVSFYMYSTKASHLILDVLWAYHTILVQHLLFTHRCAKFQWQRMCSHKVIFFSSLKWFICIVFIFSNWTINMNVLYHGFMLFNCQEIVLQNINIQISDKQHGTQQIHIHIWEDWIGLHNLLIFGTCFDLAHECEGVGC